MYLYATGGLGEPPRTPNPPLNVMCPLLLKDSTTGTFYDWLDYVNRTANSSDPISRKLVELRENQFIRESDYQNYIARCRDLAKAPPLLVPPWLRGSAIEVLKRLGILHSPSQTPQATQTPTVVPAPPISIDDEMERFRRMVRGSRPSRPQPPRAPF
jgi:hypothetical protein